MSEIKTKVTIDSAEFLNRLNAIEKQLKIVEKTHHTKVTADTSQAINGLKQVESEAKKTGTSMKDIFGGTLLAGGVLGGIGLLAGGITSVGKSMIQGNAEFERYGTQLKTLMGSAELSKNRLAELAKFGAETPFELPEIVRADKVLLGFGLTTEKTMKLAKMNLTDFRTTMGDVAAGTGSSFEEISLLFGKFSTGATGEAIARMQELGIVTKEQMKEMGIQFDKGGSLVSPLPQAFEVATKIAKDKFGGGMKELSGTFEGVLSNLQDAIGQALRDLGTPLFGLMKTVVSSIIPIVQPVAKLLSSVLEPIIKSLTPLFNSLSKFLMPVLEKIFSTLSPIFEILTPIINLIAGILPPIADIIMVILDAIKPLIRMIVDELKDTIESMMPDIVDTLRMTADLLKLIMPILIPIMQWMLKANLFMSTWFLRVQMWIGHISIQFMKFFQGLYEPAKKVFDWIYNHSVKQFELMLKGFKDTFYTPFKGMWDLLAEGIGQIFDIIKGMFDKWYNVTIKPILDVYNKITGGGKSDLKTGTGKVTTGGTASGLFKITTDEDGGTPLPPKPPTKGEKKEPVYWTLFGMTEEETKEEIDRIKKFWKEEKQKLTTELQFKTAEGFLNNLTAPLTSEKGGLVGKSLSLAKEYYTENGKLIEKNYDYWKKLQDERLAKEKERYTEELKLKQEQVRAFRDLEQQIVDGFKQLGKATTFKSLAEGFSGLFDNLSSNAGSKFGEFTDIIANDAKNLDDVVTVLGDSIGVGLASAFTGAMSDMGKNMPFLTSLSLRLLDLAEGIVMAMLGAAIMKDLVFFGLSSPLTIATLSSALVGIEVAKGLIKAKDGVTDISGAGTTTSDSIPARLSVHESVLNAQATLAGGSLMTNKEIFQWANYNKKPVDAMIVEKFLASQKHDNKSYSRYAFEHSFGKAELDNNTIRLGVERSRRKELRRV